MGGRIERIGFLGTGIMGAPMARNLARAGFAVTAWNRTASKAEAIAGDRLEVAATPGEAVSGADAVVTMLADGAAVGEVLFGLATAGDAAAGTLFIDMSSTAPSDARDHAARLEAMGHDHLDAPVSGGEVGAREATLAIMAGGGADQVSRAEALFAALGRATHVGPHGSGQLAKLANQAIVGITIGAVAEALLLAAAGGADPVAVREAMMGGFATSRVLEVHGARMIARDFTPGGRATTHLKDMDNILAAAAEVGLTLPLCGAVRGEFSDIVREMDGGSLDHSALLLWLEARNSPHRVGR